MIKIIWYLLTGALGLLALFFYTYMDITSNIVSDGLGAVIFYLLCAVCISISVLGCGLSTYEYEKECREHGKVSKKR